MKLTLLLAALAGAQVSAPESIPVRVDAGGAVLAGMGMAALLYHKRGVGESTGRYTDVGTENSEQALAQLADDARRALAVLASQPQVDPERVGLFGKAISEEELAKQLAAFQGPHGYDPIPVLRRLRTPTLWIMGDRDQNLPLRETLQALDTLPAKASGLLTLVRFGEADHGMYTPEGSRVAFWGEVRDWLVKRGVLERGSAGAR